MALKELYNPESGKMRIAGFMSGSGSNLKKIIEHERKIESEEGRAPYHVAVIFSDNAESKAEKIGKDWEVPVVVRDLGEFCKEKGCKRNNLGAREIFDAETVKALSPLRIDAIAYAGYMSIATAPLIEGFLGVNVHPADLSLMDGNKRKYTGDHAVEDAIVAGEKELRATTHIVEERVDYGRILMISRPLQVQLPPGHALQSSANKVILLRRIVDEHQNKLKEVGDWQIFPKTLELIASGRYCKDDNGNLYFDDTPIPCGVRAEELQ